MATLIVLFNLKDSGARERYEQWAATTDVPTVKGLRSVDDFQVFRTQGVLGGDGPAPFQYVEIIEVNDMERLGEEIQSETMQRVAGEFQEFADNPVFMLSERFA